jgi:hypothetical protein
MARSDRLDEAGSLGVVTVREFYELLFSLASKGVPVSGSQAQLSLWTANQIGVFSSQAVKLSDGPLNLSPDTALRVMRGRWTAISPRSGA